jgi:hypothetical protein
MEKILILGKDNKYEEASIIDEAIKEQVKKNDKHRNRRNGKVQKDKREAGELASDDVHGGGESPVV